MSRLPVALVLIALLGSAPAFAQEPPRPSEAARQELGEALLKTLSAADQMTVYRTQHTPAQEGARIDAYPILAERKLDAAADRDRVRAALFDARAFGGAPAHCFNPRHAVRAQTPTGEIATLLICFECFQMRWLEGGATIFIAGSGPLKDTLESLLVAAPGAGSAPAVDAPIDWLAAFDRAMDRIGAEDYVGARREYEQGVAALEKELAAASEEERARRTADPEFRRQRQTAHYNLGCIHALSSVGRTAPSGEAAPVEPAEAARCRDQAFEHLGKSVDSGWGDAAHLQGDPDLVPLHDDPRWAELLKRIPPR